MGIVAVANDTNACVCLCVHSGGRLLCRDLDGFFKPSLCVLCSGAEL